MGCAELAKFYAWTGFGESALALDDYSTHPGDYSNRHNVTLSQLVYQFPSGRAAKAFWRGLRVVLGRCPAWAIAPAGETTSRIFAVRLPGAAAFQMNSTIIDEKLGTLRLESLVTVVGQDVFDLDATAVGRPVPARPSVRTLTQELVARVQSR